MSEIKVGDKVIVKWISPGSLVTHPIVEHSHRGYVSEINGNCIKVKFPHGEQWNHRWQCRKLVKKNTICESCNGTGRIGCILNPGSDHDHECKKCNSKGN